MTFLEFAVKANILLETNFWNYVLLKSALLDLQILHWGPNGEMTKTIPYTYLILMLKFINFKTVFLGHNFGGTDFRAKLS